MTPQQIKRAKRLAEILGIDVRLSIDQKHWLLPHKLKDNGGHVEFNPEQDKALLWDLQLKFGVTVDRYLSECYVITFGNAPDGIDCGQILCEMEFKEAKNIPAALIDCVIEINGGYDALRD